MLEEVACQGAASRANLDDTRSAFTASGSRNLCKDGLADKKVLSQLTRQAQV